MIKIYDYKTDKEKIINIIKKRNIIDIISKDQTLLVEKILDDVRNEGDKAIKKYTNKFDKVDLDNLRVTEEEIDTAYEKIKKYDYDFIKSFKIASENIAKFHKMSVQKSFVYFDSGAILGSMVQPVEKAGIYVPGGSAPLVSTVAMNVIPAKIAGVKEIYIATPPSKEGKINEYILTAAKMLNIYNIYKIGGAQAIAALAYGTETVQKVDKITGPGNIYVTIAKKIIYGIADIDMIAGPSELVIVADNDVEDNFIAADIMSQSEHGSGLETSIAILFSNEKGERLNKKVEEFVKNSKRKTEITSSLQNHGMIIIVNNINEAVELINIIAPEHLELMIKDNEHILKKIKNAGAVFLGKYTPESAGDYIAGPNHTLPTSGTARFYSPLSVNDFLKTTNYIKYDQETLKKYSDDIIKIAETETLTAHSQCVKERFK